MRIETTKVKGDNFTLVPLGDIHIGHICCDLRMVKNAIEYIKKNKCVWVGTGDYGDAIIPTDPRFDFDSIDLNLKTPQEQYGEIGRMFEPIADKCLGLLDGNHDILHWKKHEHNYVKELAEDLDVPYLTISAYLRFFFQKFNVNFDVYVHHGWTSSRTKGGVISRIYDLANIFPWADLYVMGHVHQIGIGDKRASLYVDNELEIRDKLQWFCFAGSFLKGYVKGKTSYVEEKTYRPNVLGSPILTIIPKIGKHTTTFDVGYEEVR